MLLLSKFAKKEFVFLLSKFASPVELKRFYILYLVTTCSVLAKEFMFLSSKFASLVEHKRFYKEVLTLFFLYKDAEKKAVRDASHCATEDVIKVWAKASIPTCLKSMLWIKLKKCSKNGLNWRKQSQCGCDVADASSMQRFSNLSLSALVDTDMSSAYEDDDSKCTRSLVIYSSSACAFCSSDFCLFLLRLVDWIMLY